MTYDQLSPIHLSLTQRMADTLFLNFIAPKNEQDFKAFIVKAEAISTIVKLPLNDVLSNPETVRNILDQVADEELEIYVKSSGEEDHFIGTIDQYRQKYDIGYLHDME